MAFWGHEKGGILAAEKNEIIFNGSTPLEWYKKFRTHNNGSLQQAWAFSNGESTVDKLKNKQWRFEVLGFEKGGILAAEKKIKYFFHVSSTLEWYKSSALTTMAHSSKLGPLAMAYRLQTNWKEKNGVLRS